VPLRIWPRNRASLLFTLVTAAVVVWLTAAAGARADVFDDAQAALEQAAAQAGGAPSPASPVPVKKIEEPKKSPDTGGVAAPSADPRPDVTPDNVNISIRVESPGNDGPVTQGSSMRPQKDFDRLERHFDKQFAALKKQIERQVPAATPKLVMPVVRNETPKPPPPRPKPAHLTRVAPKAPDPRPQTPDPAHRAAPPVHERHVHKTAAPTHPHPFQLPFDNQAMSAGSSGGTSTPPPAPIAALLAAACLAASMLVTTLWDAHRRRRSRLFASRLERPG
jgi:hypothetical protein